ncbi:hypothetical protein A2154_05000 [Candidatus Gottesmanbacteria bacterium RBG_16_43_7]|uniref:Uncharacterized protein n=1 Tax=Candidatus Gottesmanbacteria bacterium RBG_16_43_7 TaxID=1798373 RepID=A0A1F5Z8L0_9BACT|nr:MAG: hypothetical protein A2154_05000 [Candidatus Gottesmanbacteria bacterium RBG_16_43_7]
MKSSLFVGTLFVLLVVMVTAASTYFIFGDFCKIQVKSESSLLKVQIADARKTSRFISQFISCPNFLYSAFLQLTNKPYINQIDITLTDEDVGSIGKGRMFYDLNKNKLLGYATGTNKPHTLQVFLTFGREYLLKSLDIERTILFGIQAAIDTHVRGSQAVEDLFSLKNRKNNAVYETGVLKYEIYE